MNNLPPFVPRDPWLEESRVETKMQRAVADLVSELPLSDRDKFTIENSLIRFAHILKDYINEE